MVTEVVGTSTHNLSYYNLSPIEGDASAGIVREHLTDYAVNLLFQFVNELQRVVLPVLYVT